MANDLGSTGLTFNFANMKPESGEQIDSLWGQNIADNTSIGYHDDSDTRVSEGTKIVGEMHYNYIQDYDDDYNNTNGNSFLFFFKKPNLDTLIGTFWGTLTAGAGVSAQQGTTAIIINGGTAHAWGTTNASGESRTKSETFSYDISGLTDNEMHRIDLNLVLGFSGASDSLSYAYNYGIFCTE